MFQKHLSPNEQQKEKLRLQEEVDRIREKLIKGGTLGVESTNCLRYHLVQAVKAGKEIDDKFLDQIAKDIKTQDDIDFRNL